MAYLTETTEIIAQFLAGIEPSQEVKPQNPEFSIQAAKELGYERPFDREQGQINRMLQTSAADFQTCLTIWSFYHDTRFFKAAASGGSWG